MISILYALSVARCISLFLCGVAVAFPETVFLVMTDLIRCKSGGPMLHLATRVACLDMKAPVQPWLADAAV